MSEQHFLQNCVTHANKWTILAKKDEIMPFLVKKQVLQLHIKS